MGRLATPQGGAEQLALSLKPAFANPDNWDMGALSAAAAVLVVVGAVLALLITPIVLVWPRASARVVPPRWRGSFVAHPGRSVALVTLVFAAWSAAAMSPLILASGDPDRPASQQATAVALVWLIFGGLTAAAVVRMLRIGIAEWAIAAQSSTAPRSAWPAVAQGSAPSPTTSVVTQPADERPAQHKPDRVLRNASRWLAAAGVAWYLLGRLTQLARGDAGAPTWWWSVTVVLLVAGAGVWASRRIRWRADDRQHSLTSPGTPFDPVLRNAGLAVHRPAGPWVGAWAPVAFVPATAIAGPALWPWAGTGVVHDMQMLVAAQHGQFRNQTGLTAGRVRTTCALRLHDVRLPQVVVAGRESIPLQHRRASIPLEFESFNRALWVYGPDARGVYDVVHPRAMAHALRELPDGASVVMHGETLAVVTDEPVSPAQLHQMMTFAVQLADMTPSYLRTSRFVVGTTATNHADHDQLG